MPVLLSSIETGLETTVETVHKVNAICGSTLDRLDDQLKRMRRSLEPLRSACGTARNAALQLVAGYGTLASALDEATTETQRWSGDMAGTVQRVEALDATLDDCNRVLGDTVKHCADESHELETVGEANKSLLELARNTSKQMRADITKTRRRLDSVTTLLEDLAEGEAKVHDALESISGSLDAATAGPKSERETVIAPAFNLLTEMVRGEAAAVMAAALTRLADALASQLKAYTTEATAAGVDALARQKAVVDAGVAWAREAGLPADDVRNASQQFELLREAAARLSRQSTDCSQAAADAKQWLDAVSSVHEAIRQMTKKL